MAEAAAAIKQWQQRQTEPALIQEAQQALRRLEIATAPDRAQQLLRLTRTSVEDRYWAPRMIARLKLDELRQPLREFVDERMQRSRERLGREVGIAEDEEAFQVVWTLLKLGGEVRADEREVFIREQILTPEGVVRW